MTSLTLTIANMTTTAIVRHTDGLYRVWNAHTAELKRYSQRWKPMKAKDWVVVWKDGKIDAAVNNSGTAAKLKKLGYTIIGYPYFKSKTDAKRWCEDWAPKKKK